jgi:hypothetical protein
MRTILIDPVANTVTEHALPDSTEGNLQSFYDVLNCDLVECITLGDGVDLWLDEEGALKEAPDRGYFVVHNMGRGHRLLAGRGLVVGHDGEGNSASLPDYITVDLIKRSILFYQADEQETALSLMDEVMELNGWVSDEQDLLARQSSMAGIMEKAVHFATVNPYEKPKTTPTRTSQTDARKGWSEN